MRLAPWPAILALACLPLSPAARAETPPNPDSPPRQTASPGEVVLSAESLARAGVTLVRVAPGAIAEVLTAPGVVAVDADRVARAPARVAGVVAKLRKRLGDRVAKGEIIAVIDSREVAEAKAEWQAAQVAEALQAELYARAEKLWDKRISAEQAFLQAKTAEATARLRLNLARHKLRALGVDDAEIVALKDEQSTGDLGLYPVRAPIDGQVIERKVDVGAAVGGLNDPSELYVIADLDRVWVELSAPASALHSVTEGQTLSLRAPDGRELTGRVIFVSPILAPDTRAARILAAVDNPGMSLRPGAFVSATLAQGPTEALRAPRAAIQIVQGRPSLFVRNASGFVARPVTLGRADAHYVEILDGVGAGEIVAAQNAFVLKAELGKAEPSQGE